MSKSLRMAVLSGAGATWAEAIEAINERPRAAITTHRFIADLRWVDTERGKTCQLWGRKAGIIFTAAALSELTRRGSAVFRADRRAIPAFGKEELPAGKHLHHPSRLRERIL